MDSAFHLGPFFGGFVAMAVEGGRLYIAGSFSAVNGVRRAGVAALDAVTGALLPWDAQL